MTDKPTPTTDLHDTLQMAEHETLTEALALLAKWSQPAQAQAGAVPLTDEQIRAMLNKHPPEDVCGWSYRMGIDDAELHHGIKGGQHGTE